MFQNIGLLELIFRRFLCIVLYASACFKKSKHTMITEPYSSIFYNIYIMWNFPVVNHLYLHVDVKIQLCIYMYHVCIFKQMAKCICNGNGDLMMTIGTEAAIKREQCGNILLMKST